MYSFPASTPTTGSAPPVFWDIWPFTQSASSHPEKECQGLLNR